MLYPHGSEDWALANVTSFPERAVLIDFLGDDVSNQITLVSPEAIRMWMRFF